MLMSNFMNAVNKYRRAHWLANHHLRPLAKIYEMWIYLIHNCFVPATCEIGEGTTFGYKGIGVVIHSRARIGKNCVIGQNVTIGGRSGHYDVPVIGDNCYIGAGATVLGPVTIGDNVTIGANAVMLKDAPSNTVWGGSCMFAESRDLQGFFDRFRGWRRCVASKCEFAREEAFVANVLFGSSVIIDLECPSGVAKKVAWQAAAFQAVTGDVAYCQFVHEGALVITRPDFEIVDRVELKSGALQRFDQYAKLGDWAVGHRVRFLYYRFDHYDSVTHAFFKRMKSSGSKVVMEFATYPYAAERSQRHRLLLERKKYLAYLMRKAHVVDEMLHIPRAKHVLDGLVTYMPHKAIWGISVTTIDNGVNPSAIPLARRPVENHDNPLTMLCVAHMSFWHGVDRLLRGMASYRASGSARPVRLLIAGPDTEELSSLRVLIGKLGLENSVEFLGPKSGQSLDCLFDTADIAVGSLGLHRIGLDQGSTLKVKEYCARGVPFIYSYREAQLTGNEPFALRLSADEDDIDMATIVDFYDHLGDGRALSRQMRSFAERHFSWESQMAVLVREYYGADCRG